MSLDLTEFMLRIVEPLSVGIAVLGTVASIYVALKAGALKKITFGPMSIEGHAREIQDASDIAAAFVNRRENPLPFETAQLANYYAQVLAQSKVSFWFSLVFASLGFVVIIAAALLYSQERTGSTVATFSAGAIIDAVAALFFVQSKNAQQAMGEFFDKLRKDRQAAESRAMCDNISDSAIQDALRVQLALHYAGIESAPNVAAAVLAASSAKAPAGDG